MARHLRATALLALARGACATFKPVPMAEVPFLERAVSQSRAGLTVTTAVPPRDEARKIFGVDLAKRQIRAGWDETEKLLTFRSALRTFRAFFGGEYK